MEGRNNSLAAESLSRAEERRDMVRRQVERRGVSDGAVLAAMRTVPRHEFVFPAQRERAYEDRPLQLGWGQTISQPYVVARMTELCALAGGEDVLEVGTGSGYQSAVLAEIAGRVYTLELVEPLLRRAAVALRRLRYDNVVCRFGDGNDGWPELAPFRAIVVTAAAPAEVPRALLEQLADGGRLVAPLGGKEQTLNLFVRRGDSFERREVGAVRFVPLKGRAE